MPASRRTGEDLVDRSRTASIRALKAVFQQRYPRDTPGRRYVFIVGMQRSGTTTLVRVFERDLRARVYQEHSTLSDQDDERGIRLNPLDDVQRELRTVRGPLIVLKPLVETQKTRQLLDRFTPSTAIWTYRHFEAVARSNVRQFDDRGGLGNLRPIVAHDRTNWRAERVPDDVEATVRDLMDGDLSQLDAAALFWWVRNRLLFDLDLDRDPRVDLLRFEDFVRDTPDAVDAVYSHIGLSTPAYDTTRAVDGAVVRPSTPVDLHPRVRALCEQLWDRLRAVDDDTRRTG